MELGSRIVIPSRQENLLYIHFKRLIGFLNQFYDGQEQAPPYSYLFTMTRTQLFKACEEHNLSAYIGRIEMQNMDQVNVLGKIFKCIWGSEGVNCCVSVLTSLYSRPIKTFL